MSEAYRSCIYGSELECSCADGVGVVLVGVNWNGVHASEWDQGCIDGSELNWSCIQNLCFVHGSEGKQSCVDGSELD